MPNQEQMTAEQRRKRIELLEIRLRPRWMPSGCHRDALDDELYKRELRRLLSEAEQETKHDATDR